MKSTAVVTQELLEAGYLQQKDVAAAESLLEPYYEAVVDAVDSRKFALEDEAHQAKVIDDAEDLAESDLEMG